MGRIQVASGQARRHLAAQGAWRAWLGLKRCRWRLHASLMHRKPRWEGERSQGAAGTLRPARCEHLQHLEHLDRATLPLNCLVSFRQPASMAASSSALGASLSRRPAALASRPGSRQQQRRRASSAAVAAQQQVGSACPPPPLPPLLPLPARHALPHAPCPELTRLHVHSQLPCTEQEEGAGLVARFPDAFRALPLVAGAAGVVGVVANRVASGVRSEGGGCVAGQPCRAADDENCCSWAAGAAAARRPSNPTCIQQAAQRVLHHPSTQPVQVAPVVSANSSQSRADVAVIVVSAVLLLTGLQVRAAGQLSGRADFCCCCQKQALLVLPM